jgi:hypothetical protein
MDCLAVQNRKKITNRPRVATAKGADVPIATVPEACW